MATEAERNTKSNARVFVSYSRRDLAFVDQLELALKNRDITTSIDRIEIYAFEDWWKRIQDLIAKADTIIFVITPDSLLSDVCGKEIQFAESLNKRFAPIMAKSVDFATVPPQLRRLNFISFDGTSEFESAADQLVEALVTDIGWIRRHTELGEIARRWATAGRPGPRGLLLRPPALDEAEAWIAARPQNAPAPTEELQDLISESRRAATRRQRVMALGALLVAIIAGSLALWADVNRREASFQRQEAVSQKELAVRNQHVAVASEAKAKLERDRALTTQSLFLADISKQKSDVGDETTAILLALEALPGENTDRPYVPVAMQSLKRALDNLRELRIYSGHEQWVLCEAIDPSEQILATGSADHAIRLWKLDSGNNIAKLEGHTDDIQSIEFDADGSRLLSLSSDGTARLWDLKKKQTITVFYPQGAEKIIGAGFLRGGVIVASADAENKVYIREEGGRLVSEITGHAEMVKRAIFSADSTKLATTSSDRLARVWDVGSGRLITTTIKHPGDINSTEFSADARQLVTTSTNGSAHVFETPSGSLLRQYAAPQRDVNHASFSPDGKYIVTAESDGRSRIVEIASGDVLSIFTGHSAPISQARFSNRGDRVLSASWDGTARLWSTIPAGGLAEFRGHKQRVTDVVFAPSSQVVVTAFEDNTAMVWDIIGNAAIANLKEFDRPISRVAINADGTRIVTAGANGLGLWNATSGRLMVNMAPQEGFVNVVESKFSADGVLFAASVNGQGSTKYGIWSVSTGDLLTAFNEKIQGELSFSPDHSLVAGDTFGAVTVWNVQTGQKVFDLKGHRSQSAPILFSPNGSRLLTSSYDGSAKLWDLHSGSEIASVQSRGDSARSFKGAACFNSDNTAYAADFQNSTSVIAEVASGRIVARGVGFVPELMSFSADNRYLALAGPGAIDIWSVADWKEEIRLSGFNDSLEAIAFSADGARIMAKTIRGVWYGWSLPDGMPIEVSINGQTIRGFSAISSDGTRVALVDNDVVRIFERKEVAHKDLLRTAIALVQRCIPQEQRQSFYLPGEMPSWCADKIMVNAPDASAR